MKTVFIIFAIIYGIAFIPSLKTAIAFWLHKDNDAVAYISMKDGFMTGLISIWIIYPFYIIKSCYDSIKNRE